MSFAQPTLSRLDKLTRLLCSLCEKVEALDPSLLDEETTEWYENHQAIDTLIQSLDKVENETERSALLGHLAPLLEKGSKL
jgi:hypothetical protein